MNNIELIEKIEEMDSNKDIMLEELVADTERYMEYIKGTGEKIITPYTLVIIDNEEYAIFFIKSTKEEVIDSRKSKYMEIFEVYKNSGFVAYAGRDVYNYKNSDDKMYCQLEEVEPVKRTITEWRYK